MRSLQRNQKSLEKFYHRALEDLDMEGLQILAPLMENANAPFPSEPMAGSSRFLKRHAGWTPIQVAAIKRRTQVLQVLAPLADNLNDTYPFLINGMAPMTPIFLAAYLGHEEIVEVIAPLVVDPNREDEDGVTPLGVAIKNGHLSVVKILVPFVNNLNASQFMGGSAMVMAAMHGHLEIIRFLAQFVDPSTPDPGGKVPIFGAIYNQHPEAVKLLAYLSMNSPTPMMKSSFTLMIQFAEQMQAEEIVEILKTVEKAHFGS